MKTVFMISLYSKHRNLSRGGKKITENLRSGRRETEIRREKMSLRYFQKSLRKTLQYPENRDTLSKIEETWTSAAVPVLFSEKGNR